MLCNMYEARTVETIATSLVKVNQRNLFIFKNGNTISKIINIQDVCLNV